MKKENPTVWECEHEVIVNAGCETIWRLLSDVSRWPLWNAGVERIELLGPFEAGTQFVMTSPGQDPLTSRLVEVNPNVGFLDETRVGDHRIFVDHRLEAIAADRTRVVFSLEAFGPSCDDIGPQVSADFPDVLKSLAARAEAMQCDAVS